MADKNEEARPRWEKLESEEIFSTRYFRMRVDKCRMPRGTTVPKYFVMEFPDWVQALALTPAGELIVVDQYRHAAEKWFLEFPGGSTHAGGEEDPLLAARRELKEETGYESSEWIYAGFHYPNPALQNNRCHVYIARDCVKTAEPDLDPYEEIHVKLMSIVDFRREILASGRGHSLMLASLELAKDHLKSSVSN